MAKTEIDNKKMWEAMAKFAPNKESLLWVNMCVESQGLKLNDNFEIVSVEPKTQRIVSAEVKEALLSDGELTEFKDKLRFIINNNPSGVNFNIMTKELLSIAEKEISNKIVAKIQKDMDWMTSKF